jgi:glycosyltransferase involved in cell wall biosynthesis
MAAMPSSLLADLWIGSGFSEKAVRLIPPGVDFSTCRKNRDDALRESLGLSTEDIAVYCIAPQGRRDALWATSILHQLDPRWVFVHCEEPDDSLVEFARKISGESVLRLANPSVKAEDLLSSADLVLSTSRGFCPVHPIVDSMALGLPIVGFATPFNTEYLEHRANALLVNPGAIADLARRMLEMRENPSLQWRLADQARRTAYERCSISNHLKGFKNLYQSPSALAS